MSRPHCDALRAVGLLGRVEDLGAALAAQGVAAVDVAQLAQVAHDRRARNVAGLVKYWIESTQAADVLRQSRVVVTKQAPKAKIDSGLDCVSESNPYGWRREREVAVLDHDLPGQWNGFRQSYNMTAGERVMEGAIDHRRRGCSRFEVLGSAEGAVSSASYDGEAVEQANREAERSES